MSNSSPESDTLQTNSKPKKKYVEVFKGRYSASSEVQGEV